MRLLVCGGRDFDDVPRLWRILDDLNGRYTIACLIDGAQEKQREDGGVVGADYWAHQWACARGAETERFHANWTELGKSAGPKRNQRMIDEGKPTHCLAMPGGRGTADMVSRAKAAGIPVRVEQI